MENTKNHMLSWAQFFIEQGWPVLPIHYPTSKENCSCGNKKCSSLGKHPMVRHGLKDASTDKKVIDSWWKNKPLANIGILTGKESGLQWHLKNI